MVRNDSSPIDATAPYQANLCKVGIALAVGVLLLLVLPTGVYAGREELPLWRWAVAVGCGLIAILPGVYRPRMPKGLMPFADPTPRQRVRIALGVWLVASGYFVITALNQGRDFFPLTQDECSYAIQTQMIAHGRLWMPQHQLADFFESIYLITRPVYASMYFPGTALLNAPRVWLHLPYACIPVLTAGAVVAMVYRLIAEMLNPLSGLLAALYIVSLSWYRMFSIMEMSQIPEALMGLLMIWAWMRWRSCGSQGRRWLLLIGLFAGWAAITRPVDAICFAAPVGVAVVATLRKQGKQLAIGIMLIVVGAAPFLILQLVLNHGVTGRWLQTPFSYYAQRYLPGTEYGFHPLDPKAKVQSNLFQKQLLYKNWAMDLIRRHQWNNLLAEWWHARFSVVVESTLPVRPILLLLPLGLVGLKDRRQIVLLCAIPLFILLYAGYTFFLEHYALIIAPAVGLLAVRAIHLLFQLGPARLATGVLFMMLGFLATNTWELNHWDHAHLIDDVPFRSDLLTLLHSLPTSNAIVLFRYGPSPDDLITVPKEPVYNVDVPWPDQEPMIRAHDLGPRDVELFDYYARIRPSRTVSLFDRNTKKVRELGPVGELARQNRH